jgi:hypothetical protein
MQWVKGEKVVQGGITTLLLGSLYCKVALIKNFMAGLLSII